MLQNLISNALRYTQRGGVLVGCRLRGGRVQVQVWDSGPGIAEQHREASSTSSAASISLALGRERPGPGTLDLRPHRPPAADRARPAVEGRPRLGVQRQRADRCPGRCPGRPPAAAEAPSPASLTGRLVLCVDNEKEILDGMTALLTRWGVRVLVADGSAEARRLFESDRPDVVLADYRLGEGDCDGLELLQSLRARRRATGRPGPCSRRTRAPRGGARANLGYPCCASP